MACDELLQAGSALSALSRDWQVPNPIGHPGTQIEAVAG